MTKENDKDIFGFSKAIDNEAIKKLSPEKLKELLKILDKMK
tara:strand:+ start:196 stop:318 length:123 start_codon:yes stop_codon:yes gene_type:complete